MISQGIHVVRTGSHPKIPPEKKKKTNSHKIEIQENNNKGPSHRFYFYNFHNPTHTPSQKLISIAKITLFSLFFIKFIKIIKINSIKFIKLL